MYRDPDSLYADTESKLLYVNNLGTQLCFPKTQSFDELLPRLDVQQGGFKISFTGQPLHRVSQL